MNWILNLRWKSKASPNSLIDWSCMIHRHRFSVCLSVNFKALLTWNFNIMLIYSKNRYFFQKNSQNWHLSIIMHYMGNNSKIGVSAMENRLRGIYICCRCLNKVSYEFPTTYLTFPSETMWKYWKFVNICEHMWF